MVKKERRIPLRKRVCWHFFLLWHSFGVYIQVCINARMFKYVIYFFLLHWHVESQFHAFKCMTKFPMTNSICTATWRKNIDVRFQCLNVSVCRGCLQVNMRKYIYNIIYKRSNQYYKSLFKILWRWFGSFVRFRLNWKIKTKEKKNIPSHEIIGRKTYWFLKTQLTSFYWKVVSWIGCGVPRVSLFYTCVNA